MDNRGPPAGTPLIELNGAGAGGSDGMHISGGNSTAKGLAINRVRRERYFGKWN